MICGEMKGEEEHHVTNDDLSFLHLPHIPIANARVVTARGGKPQGRCVHLRLFFAHSHTATPVKMGKHAQLVMGPAGSGKSTYVNTIRTHCETAKRAVHCVNLDPAAEVFEYPVTIDIRELISVDEVMEELPYGPNGGLIYAMEFLSNNMDWFEEQLGDFESDYLILDCPGQIELYSHINIMRTFVDKLQQWGYSVCGVFLLDANFMIEPRYVSTTQGLRVAHSCTHHCTQSLTTPLQQIHGWYSSMPLFDDTPRVTTSKCHY
jgi:hypothetical protein